jgi:hypothetical protein
MDVQETVTPVIDNEEAATVTALPVARPKKTAKPKKRTAEELQDVAPKKMTDAEKNDYIDYLRKELSTAGYQAAAYQTNAKSAFEQCRTLQQQFDEYKLQANAKLNYVRSCVDHCRTSIILAGGLEEKK